MSLDPPEVIGAASSGVCAYAVAHFLNKRGLQHCDEDPESSDQIEFVCPREESPVIFDVEEIEARSEANPTLQELQNDLSRAVAHLRNIQIFKTLPAHALAELAQRIQIQTFVDGDVVIQKGYPGHSLYIVYSGVLEVLDYAEDQISSVVNQLKANDCFGEVSILTGSPSVASVIARGEVTLFAISKLDFDKLLRENPSLASGFTRLLASRLMATNFFLVKEGSKPFSGKLSAMSIVTVVQVLSDSRRGGTLKVRNDDGTKGELGFQDGHLFTAKLRDEESEEAVYEMLTWKKGEFWLDRNQVPEEDKIQNSVMGLLMEGMRRIDEAEHERQNGEDA